MIQCNGEGFLVTSNLYSALLHLRDPQSDMTLWIDAICINQKNDREKKVQIEKMGEIYRCSKRTIIWLGDGGFLYREAFLACSMMASRCRGQIDPTSPSILLPSNIWGILWPFLILILLRRSYFTRVWIIQEVALSHDIEIACGQHRIRWREFALGAGTVLFSNICSKSARGLGNILLAQALLPCVSQSGRLDPATIFKTLTKNRLPLDKNILAMAILFRSSHSTDPVDKIYGLLDLCEHIQRGSTYGILPVYSRDDPYHRDRIYANTARAILAAQKNLQIFSAVNRRLPNCYDVLADFCSRFFVGRIQTRTLPSWVPDWSDTGNMATPLSLMLGRTDVESTGNVSEYDSGSYQPRVASNRAAEEDM